MPLPTFVTINPDAGAQQLFAPLQIVNTGNLSISWVTTASAASFATAQDLVLWCDKTWKFTVGLVDASSPGNYFGFGKGLDTSVASFLQMPDSFIDTPYLAVDRFVCAASPFGVAMGKIVGANAPPWWLLGGGFLGQNADNNIAMIFEAKSSDSAIGYPIFLSAENGLHVSCARSDADAKITFEVGDATLMQIKKDTVDVFANMNVTDSLISPEKGIKIRQLTDAPLGADGAIGELCAFFVDGHIRLYVKVAAGVWKKTAAFTEAPPP